MERVQWKACRIITGCMMSTHTQLLQVIVEIPSLKIRMQKMRERFIAFLASLYDHPMVDKLRIVRSLNNDFMNNMMNYDLYKFNNFPFYNKYGWDIKLVESQMKNRVQRKEDCSNIEYIYTAAF